MTTTSTATRPRVIGIRPIDVTTDERAQRTLDPKRVREIAEKFSEDSLGIPAVSRRADGTMVWVDGQTRGAVLVALGKGNKPIQCQVYDRLTLPEEAALFRRLNNAKAVSSADQYRIAVTEGDPIAVASEKALRLAGWDMRPGRANSMRALNTLYVCWERDEAATKRALVTLASSWGPTPASGNLVFLRGMWMFAYRYGGPELAVEWDKLALHLARQRGGAKMFLSEVRSLADTRRVGKPDAFADMVTNIYNRSRRSRFVPDWSTGG